MNEDRLHFGNDFEDASQSRHARKKTTWLLSAASVTQLKSALCSQPSFFFAFILKATGHKECRGRTQMVVGGNESLK